MEKLKSLENLGVPDSRWAGWVWLEPLKGVTRSFTLAEYYGAIAAIELSTRVPDDVQQHFQTAQHLMIYAWYVYRFGVVAEAHAYGSLEYALRLRLGVAGRESADARGTTLAPLLRRAVREGLIADRNFPSYQLETEPPIVTGNAIIDANLASRDSQHESESRVATLVRAIPQLRNMFAHGSSSLWPGSSTALRVVAEAINQLF